MLHLRRPATSLLNKCGLLRFPRIVSGPIGNVSGPIGTTDPTETGGEDYGASDNEDEAFKSAQYIAITTGYGDSALLPRARECAVPVATEEDLDDEIEYLIDSGADFDI